MLARRRPYSMDWPRKVRDAGPPRFRRPAASDRFLATDRSECTGRRRPIYSRCKIGTCLRFPDEPRMSRGFAVRFRIRSKARQPMRSGAPLAFVAEEPRGGNSSTGTLNYPVCRGFGAKSCRFSICPVANFKPRGISRYGFIRLKATLESAVAKKGGP